MGAQTPNPNPKTKIFQIHGALVKTIPVDLINQPYKLVDKSGHFMVYNQAALISEMLEKELRS